MCLILVAWRAHAEYPLLLAANRDEYHARPAAPAAWWPRLRSWPAGICPPAAPGWASHVTDASPRSPISAIRHGPSARRPVAANWCRPPWPRRLPAQRALQQLRSSAGNYNDFNLIFSDGEQLAVFESVAGEGRLLGPGVYGLSNHLLDTPWPKVQNAKSALSAALSHLPDEQRCSICCATNARPTTRCCRAPA